MLKSNFIVKLGFFVVVLISMIGCKNKYTYICSVNKEQCITIADVWPNKRYITDGKREFPFDFNYIKYKNRDYNTEYDAIFICWKGEVYDWEIFAPNAENVTNKLSNNRNSFTNEYEFGKDSKGVKRTITKFHTNNCFEFSFSDASMMPEGSALIEYPR